MKYHVLSGFVDKTLAKEFAIFKIKLSFLTDILLLALVKTIQKNCFPGTGGNDTPSLRVSATRILKELPWFGLKFSNIHPALESGFLPGTFSGGSIVMQISFVMLIFLLFVLKQVFEGGRGKLLEGKASSQPNNVSKHRNELFYWHVASLFK